LEAIFTKPSPSALPWNGIMSLFRALDATITEGQRVSVCIELNGHDATIPRATSATCCRSGTGAERPGVSSESRDHIMNTLTYKGYHGAVEVDPEAGILFGRVLDLDAVLTFEAETVPEAVAAFRDTVDDYLDWCAERGKQPEKPFSGKLVLRIPPNVHHDAVIAATRRQKSLNAWLADVVARAAHEEAKTA
jgi:predicted HicB family RNase H-like nuclease